MMAILTLKPTDDAPAVDVFAALWACALLWEGDARLFADVRAKDIARACAAQEALLAAVEEYLDYCAAPGDATGDPVLLQIRERLRAQVARATGKELT